MPRNMAGSTSLHRTRPALCQARLLFRDIQPLHLHDTPHHTHTLLAELERISHSQRGRNCTATHSRYHHHRSHHDHETSFHGHWSHSYRLQAQEQLDNGALHPASPPTSIQGAGSWCRRQTRAADQEGGPHHRSCQSKIISSQQAAASRTQDYLATCSAPVGTRECRGVRKGGRVQCPSRRAHEDDESSQHER